MRKRWRGMEDAFLGRIMHARLLVFSAIKET